ncbi:Rhodanese-like domain-containing protein [Halteromyces radiatus]|uniref:Rhodanese-like domain-containing protein n=1 Tax=Halteromyces radiatus TaxID=101107 RepID=UPI00221E57D5|nr:Rhodanese-like domain-containing protein [Halteromyces radiatus]KAI8093135.1 Rhodanese-like domain-containing protein [Halteromyces radiatus]
MTTLRPFSSLISTQELASSLDNKKQHRNDIKVLDASWHMPNANRDPYQEFLAKRIPGAQFFGIDTIKDTSVDLPHMLPSVNVFAEAVGDLGISNKDHVVVYDSVGAFSAARVYWTFKAFGHDQVSILNGGLPEWIRQGYTLATGTPDTPTKEQYTAKFDQRLVRDYATILDHCRQYQQGKDVPQILDARALPRFTGEAPEPRPGLSSGHMPGSICIPFQLVADDSGLYKDDQALRKMFESHGVDLDKPIITSCGSGITASVLYFALERAGAKDIAVYDGSWTEYADKKDSIIIKD